MSDDFKSDLRSTSQGYKRAAAQKAKWAHGVHVTASGRATDHPRPARVSDHFAPSVHRHRVSGSALKAASAKKTDMDAARAEYPVIARKLPALNSDESASSTDEDYDDPLVEDGDVHGATVNRAPASGSQVLSSALAKAIEAFEDKETVQLVRTEWSVLDDDGEEVGFSPARKVRGKKDKVAGIEDDYEIV
ncbi:hypothetical protein ANO11243_002230 [Dothideomycetidae sp. 11243]|nr:hypothetical protein ANO11243_002230 [fungal sp. No.11243]